MKSQRLTFFLCSVYHWRILCIFGYYYLAEFTQRFISLDSDSLRWREAFRCYFIFRGDYQAWEFQGLLYDFFLGSAMLYASNALIGNIKNYYFNLYLEYQFEFSWTTFSNRDSAKIVLSNKEIQRKLIVSDIRSKWENLIELSIMFNVNMKGTGS